MLRACIDNLMTREKIGNNERIAVMLSFGYFRDCDMEDKQKMLIYDGLIRSLNCDFYYL